MQNFDIVTARLVLALAREGSIGRAAQRENIAPSAISRRIAELEGRLGVVLFDRSPHGVRPTLAGQAYAEGCRTVLRAVADLHAGMSDFAEGKSGNVRVACGTSALSGRLPELLASFAHAHPRLAIELHEMTALECLTALDDARVDVAVTADNNDLTRFETEPFQDDPVWVLAPSDHPLAPRLSARQPISFAEVSEHEVVGVHESGSLDRLLDHATGRLGRPLGKRVRVERFSSLVRVVEAGLGIGFLRATSLHLLAGTDVAAAPLSDPWAQRHLIIARRKGAPVSAALDAFLGLCRTTRDGTSG